MVVTKVKTKEKMQEFDHDLVTVLLVKRSPLCEKMIAGKSILDWTKSAVSDFRVEVVETQADVQTLIKQTKVESKYIFVIDGQYPILTKQDIHDMVEYTVIKEAPVAHFGCGYMIDTTQSEDLTLSLYDFVVPIATDHCAKVDSEEVVNAYAVIINRRIINYHISNGVIIEYPESTLIDSNVIIGKNVKIAPFVMLLDHTVIGQDCKVASFSILRKTTVMDGAVVNSSTLDNVLVREGAIVKPYSVLNDCQVY